MGSEIFGAIIEWLIEAHPIFKIIFGCCTIYMAFDLEEIRKDLEDERFYKRIEGRLIQLFILYFAAWLIFEALQQW